MSVNTSNGRRIAKNTVFLYIRMFFSMGVSLYTSRVVLDTLGVEDYGVWNVVAGVIAMFSFLNTSMSTATSRFMMYELGKEDKSGVQRVFSGACTIHLIIAFLVLVLGETVGLWFLQNKLVIPEDRIFAANVIYQMTVLSSMVSITQVPYNASIMANEKMDVYAYIEMGNTCLRLAIVFLLVALSYDKLIVYGILTLTVTIGVAVTYRIYCSKKLYGCKYVLIKDKNIILPMLSFSGWDLYGNLSVMARTQGVNMLLNIFFTASMNAASGVATQVQGAIMSFAGNVVQAFRPQIVKSYALGDTIRMSILINKAAQFTTMLLLLFTVPLCIEIDYVLNLWLKIVPDYASRFCIWTLIFNIFTNISGCIVYGIHATGRVRTMDLINGTLYLLVIPISYFGFKLGGSPVTAYIINVCTVICGMLSNMLLLNKYVKDFKIRPFVYSVYIKSSLGAAIVVVLCMILKSYFDESFVRLCLVCCVSIIVTSLYTYVMVMSKNERLLVSQKLKSLYTK